MTKSSCLALLSALVLQAGPAFAGDSAVRNLDFEEGFALWEKPGRLWTVEAGAGYNGTTGLVWTCDDPKAYAFPIRRFTLEPGAAYRITGLVKVDDLKDGRAQVGLEWRNRDGKWLAGCYAAPVDDNGILKDGWVRYVATTRAMPADVGKGGLVCVVSKGATGRVRFDDLTFEKIPVKPVVYLVTSAYRDAAEKGKVRVLASIHADPAKCTARLGYVDATGAKRTAEPVLFEAEKAMFELDVANLATGTQELLFALTEKGGAALGSRTLRFTRLTEPSKRRVSFDAQRRMLLDGKPWFPLGLYTGRMTDEDIREYARGPFNFACQYGRITADDLDRWQKVGVYVATDVRSLIYGYNYSAKSRLKTPEDSRAAFQKLYAKIGRHPALLMWYLNDEAPLEFVPNTSVVNELLHELDPDRATLTCLCQPKTAFDFLPSYDVMAHDCYPVGNHVGKSMLERVTRQMREIDGNMMSMRPLWFIPQAMDWKWCYKGDSLARCDKPYLRFPTREEMANMTWQSIACGANGIVSYAFHSMRKNLKGEEYEKAWGDVCSVGFEVKKMEGVLLADGLPVETSGLPTYVVARAWRHGGGDWYLVVNATREPQTAKIALPEARSSLETAVGGGVTLAADGRALDCVLPPAGYAFVKVTAPVAGTVPAYDRVKIGGRLGARIDACVAHSVKASDVARMTAVFREQKETILWQSEFWGKWMHSAVPFAIYSGDAELRDMAIRSAKEVMACQLPDGYVGNYTPEKQAGAGTWDVWGRKYTLLGLVHYYDLSGDRAALESCARIVDHLMTQVGPGRRSLAATGSHRGLASLSILEPLVLLWERTQDVRYRNAIDYVLSEMDGNPNGPELLRRASRNVAERFADAAVRDSNSPAKAYEMMSCYQGLLEWYRVSGDRRCLDACLATARNIAATEINVLGGGSSMECWYGGAALETHPAIGPQETCVTTTWMRFLESLLVETGDPSFADGLERTLFNAHAGAMRRDAAGWVQYCPVDGHRGQGNLQCDMGTSCCIQNGPRGFLAAMRALVTGRGDMVDVNLYAESSATVKAAGGEVTVAQATDYPRSGKVRLTIGCRGTSGEWTLRLRIPGWSAADGRPSWRSVRRAWADGDTYELDLDMKPRTVLKDGCLAILRGPVVLARSGTFGDGETGEALARPFAKDWCPLALKPVDPGEALVAFDVAMPFGTYTGDKRKLDCGIRTVRMCDWASAGDLWSPKAFARVWLPVALDPTRPAKRASGH